MTTITFDYLNKHYVDSLLDLNIEPKTRYTRDIVSKNLRDSQHIIIVATYDHKVVGVLEYKSLPYSLMLKNLVVDKNWRRRGIGDEFITLLKEKLIKTTKIECLVDEYNLPVQLLLKKHKFLCINTIKQYSSKNSTRYDYYFIYEKY